ncbi:MAG TPA: transglutaminase-like domain-containing protein [Bacteroidales bacterium]|nr:transglutaminase-like domain-containing protein [Bacteroidales bacterium]
MSEKPLNRELNALVSLIDEPDQTMFDQVRNKIFAYGLDAVPLLEEAWDTNADGQVQKRIETIIHTIQFDHNFHQFNLWRNTPNQDLLAGFILVAKYQYPELNEKTITDQVGQIIQDVWLEINNNLTPLEKVKIINHIFYDVHGFRGNKRDIQSPQNSYVNTVLETRKANPISLSIIYMVVAQSLKVPIYGINLPQNFILAYLNDFVTDYSTVTRRQVQFYLNVFNNGAVFTQREVEMFLRQINLEQEDRYFLPCDNVTIIRRVMNNLIFSYENSRNPDKAAELKKLQQALD